MPKSELRVIVSSPLMIIRPKMSKVNPDYLVWSLTNSNARRYYAQYSRGSTIIGIGKRDLELMEISLPDLEIQHKIGQLKSLEKQENQLLEHYQKLRFKLTNKLMTDVIYKEKTT
jgi:restriction endonuclease S subunit